MKTDNRRAEWKQRDTVGGYLKVQVRTDGALDERRVVDLKENG